MVAHDTHFINNLQGCPRSSNDIISSNLNKIDRIVYLTEWQKKHYHEKAHPEVKYLPYCVINNGITTNVQTNKKVKNSFH